MTSAAGLHLLFPQIDSEEFLKAYFPFQLIASDGPLTRFGSLATSPLASSEHFLSLLGKTGENVIVHDATSLGLSEPIAWVEALETELGLRRGQVTCHTIYTPKGKGTGRHFDSVEGITIQVCGKKLWRYEENSELPISNRAGVDPSLPRMQDDSKHFVLSSGSASFLPRGWWHDTVAIETAISLHFELRLDSWYDLASRWLQRSVLNCRVWRSPVPTASVKHKTGADEQWLALREQLMQRLSTTAVSDLLLPTASKGENQK